MFIRYKVATLGTMQVGFTPLQEDKINKNMNYDDKNVLFRICKSLFEVQELIFFNSDFVCLFMKLS